jgi:hypothetical protein
MEKPKRKQQEPEIKEEKEERQEDSIFTSLLHQILDA